MLARLKALAVSAVALSATAAAPPPAPAAQACAMTVGDAEWLQGALAAWRLTARKGLGLRDAPTPDLVLVDAACTWRASAAAAGSDPQLTAEPHGNTVTLPSGGEIPVGVVSFAAPWDHDRRSFLVMSLPGVWEAGGVKSELTLQKLMTSVFVHEVTHTRQFYAFAPRMADLTKRWNLPDDLDDDAVQTRFAKETEYVAAYQAERDLLYRASTEPDRAKAKAAAREAWSMIQARRARWFVGADAKYADLEDAFLTLEGIGNYAAFSWLTDPEGGGFARDVALGQFRRGGRYWSQDEGLAVFLVVDRFVPDWRARAFAPKAATALELLAEAAA